MKKLNKVAMLIASAALTSAAGAQTIDNWRATDGTVWKNGTNELCWRDNFWTPATAHSSCDGAIAPPKPEPAPAPKVTPPALAPVVVPPPPPPTPPVPPAPVKVTFSADAFFDFDKAILKPAGKAKLDELMTQIKDVNVDLLVAVGHTDSIGSRAYNQKLSVKRANAVKAYLVSKGMSKDKVRVEGKGESQPIASNKTMEGRAKNRRVEVEVTGMREPK